MDNGQPSRTSKRGSTRAEADATKDSAGDSDNCTHPELTDEEPEFWDSETGGGVNVEHRCTRCGKAVAVTSWRREAWDEDQKKPKPRRYRCRNDIHGDAPGPLSALRVRPIEDE